MEFLKKSKPLLSTQPFRKKVRPRKNIFLFFQQQKMQAREKNKL
jgi:hypothetical protein